MSDELVKVAGQDKQEARLLRWTRAEIQRGATLFEVLHKTELGASKVGEALATDYLAGKKQEPDAAALTSAVLAIADEDAAHARGVATYMVRTRKGRETTPSARFFVELEGRESDEGYETEAPNGTGYLAQIMRHAEVNHKTTSITTLGTIKLMKEAFEQTAEALQRENGALRDENAKLRRSMADKEIEVFRLVEDLLSKKGEREIGFRKLLLEEKRNEFLTGKLDGMLDLIGGKFLGHVTKNPQVSVSVLVGGLLKRLTDDKLEQIFRIFGDDPEAQAMLFEALKSLKEAEVRKEEETRAKVEERAVSGQ